MSYQKYYGRQFIKLEEDKYIPLVLWGANNCTEFVNGREVLERNWCPLGRNDVTSVGAFARWVWDNASSMPDTEVWMNGSKWVYWKNMPRWMANAFYNSLTIEEIYEKTGKALTLTLYERQRDSGSVVVKSWKCTKTEEILAFFEIYDNLSEEKKRVSYVWYDFGTREPLKLPKPAVEGKVIVKDRQNKRYLSKCESNALSFSPDPNDALVFESEKDVWSQLGNGWKASVKIFSVKALERAKQEKNFVIRCDNRGYVKERTRAGLYFANSKDTAKKFATEREAEKYKEKLKIPFAGLVFKVVDIRKPFKPDCALIGEDGNIFNLMAVASKTLKVYNMADKAEEMCKRIKSSGSYDEALCIIGEYVNITSKGEYYNI